MKLTSEVDLNGVVLNGVRMGRGEPLQSYERILGPPSRLEMPGAPPPYGHRNNVLHFYDDIGLLLREHHSSYLIQSIDYFFESGKQLFPTRSDYSGELRVLGIEVRRGMDFSEFASHCPTPFKPHLGHAWFFDGDRISIQFEVYRPKGKGAAQRELISALCVGFRGAHRQEASATIVGPS
jgi:hypothetical protein